jgi:hypothetical protein
MKEVIRFFWRGGEATLPIEAIPEADRSPLQVRLRVLRENVSDVIKLLEHDRHVAAAWPSGGQILLIGCHPNIARRSEDAVCLDARNLPQVVLRLKSWDEAPEAAQLLLTAFGGEARDEKECITARIDLRDWLLKRNQNDTAEIVKRYFTFPIYPLGQISRVGLQTATAMKAIADAAGGKWPLPESLEPAWRRFVVTAFRDDVAFDPDELTRWFTANGWDAHASAELAKRFFAEATLLGEYEEEARPA